MKNIIDYRNKILVTGGAGNVGSSLAEKLISNENNYVVIVDDLTTGKAEKLPSSALNARFIKADVNNYNEIAAIMLAFRFDYVFHYAAVVGVQRTLNNPVKVLEDINGIKNILELSKNTGVKRVFYSSSSEVYGEPVEFPQNEDTTPLNSKLPYAIVKNVGEAFLRSYQREYNLDFTIFRFFNTYGPRQSDDFVIAKFIKRALKNEDITIYGDGSQTRTFCYIDDNIEATVAAFEKDLFVNDTINIGNNNETSILDLAKTVIRLTDSKSAIVHLPALTSKMKVLLGRELTSLEQGIINILQTGLF
jgi:UDP-glucose 4-epimerase